MAFQRLSVYPRLPPLDLFDWRFDDAPKTIPPISQSDSTWTQPFTISQSLFHDLLEVKVPVTIAATYLVTVIILNRVNESRQYKPWGFSRTSIFKLLVLLHNILLAIFSAWTFYGLFCSLRSCWPSKTEPNFLPRAADSLCRIAGENELRGTNFTLGNNHARYFFQERPLLDANMFALPDTNRLWTTGYAYFSWLFYLSKFYEVVDTLIILAKGKRSSMLQTYHHTGVMFCMWATVRYMSPPGLVGIFFNSAIHTLMYFYFAWTSLGLPVLGYIKQALTTLQITQFVVGGLFACTYLFIEYDALVHRLGDDGQGLPPAITEDMRFSSPAPTMSSAREGHGVGFHNHSSRGLYEVRRTPCLERSSQAFAVWLTILYILPLIYLFLCFFNRSYLKRAKSHVK